MSPRWGFLSGGNQHHKPPETKRREIGFHVKHEDDAKPKARRR
jgi:hypothetical protein